MDFYVTLNTGEVRQGASPVNHDHTAKSWKFYYGGLPSEEVTGLDQAGQYQMDEG